MRSLGLPQQAPEAPKAAETSEMKLRAASADEPPSREVHAQNVWHDVRSVLAAATTNVEYLSSIPGVSTEVAEVSREVEHELRLAASVIELATAQPAPGQFAEIDLRAMLWLARRAGGRVVVDASSPPFLLRGTYESIQMVTEAIVAAVDCSAHARLLTERRTARVLGLDASKLDALANVRVWSRVGVLSSIDSDALLLCHPTE